MEIVQEKGGHPHSTVWGSRNLKVPMEDAAFANATMADVLDWEDCGWTGHPLAGAIPVAYAVAEKEHLSGKKYIEAVTAAYEVYQRLAMSVQPKPSDWGKAERWKGWGLVSWQIYAASVAAAKLLGLDEVKTATHFGIALHQMNVVGPKRGGSDVYHFAHGFCAKNGLNSAVVAKKGIEDYDTALDGNDGMWSQVSDTVDWSWYEKGLGERYLIEETLLKHWPANMWIQAPLEILDQMYREHPFRTEEIRKIRVSPVVDLFSWPITFPMGSLGAQFSLGYCFTAYLNDQDPSADWFSEDKLQGGVLENLQDKIEFFGEQRNPLEQFEFFWKSDFPETAMEIELTDGTRMKKILRYPKGHPKNPFTWEEEADGFRRKAACLTEEQKERFIEAVRKLEDVEDLSQLSSCLLVQECQS